MAVYTEAPSEVLEIARQIIDQYLPALDGCRIGFVMREEAKKSGDKVIWGQTGKINERFMPFLKEELDIVIELAEDVWAELRGEQKNALVHHEMLHIVETKNGSWSTRSHDIEEFTQILDIYGLWRQSLFNAGTSMKHAVEQLSFGGEVSEQQPAAGRLVAIPVRHVSLGESLGDDGEDGDDED